MKFRCTGCGATVSTWRIRLWLFAYGFQAQFRPLQDRDVSPQNLAHSKGSQAFAWMAALSPSDAVLDAANEVTLRCPQCEELSNWTLL